MVIPAGFEGATPPSATVQATFGAHSRAGRSHALNEDHYLVVRLGRHQETLLTSLHDEAIAARFDEYGYAMIVADGMGRPGAGETASRLALVTLLHLIRRFGRWNLRVDDAIAREIMARAERFYRHVDGTVMLQHQDGTVPTDQTTLTAAFSAGRDLFFAHVGHSRAYLLRSGHLMRLTRDHTLGRHASSALVRAPLMDVNATARDLTHILTDTIGMCGSLGPTIDIERLTLQNDDRVLVCTNGLTDALDESRIADIMSSARPPDEQCRRLVDLALGERGLDDVTALVACYRIPE